MVGVLSQQPRGVRSLLAGQRPARPAPRGQEFTKPPRVFFIDALPLRRVLLGKPSHVLPLRRGHQLADPLILITPGQQFPPEFFIHPAIPPPPCPAAEG
jgi:hypothetical protein